MKIAILAALLCLGANNAHAVVVTGALTDGQASAQGGSFVILGPGTGFSVGNDTFQTPDLYGFSHVNRFAPTRTRPDGFARDSKLASIVIMR